MSRKLRGFVLAVAVALPLAGCVHETAADRAPRPDPITRLAPRGEPVWREDLGDKTLADLLHRADVSALDIKVALARLEKAQAEADVAAAARYPQIGLGAVGAVGARNFSSQQRSAAAPSVEASYEFDFAGRIASLVRASEVERQASAADVTTARRLVAAETAAAYVALCTARDETAAAERRLGSARQVLAVARAREAEGVTLPQDVEGLVAAGEVAAEAGQAARAAEALAGVRLRSLLGGAELPPVLGCAFSNLGPAPETMSAAQVDTRPDVQAAFARLKAADFRRAAAVAAERPQFQITAALGTPDAAITTLLDARALVWAFAARVEETVFDGGAGRARIRGATAEADIADLGYRKVVLQAWSELATAAVNSRQAGERLTLAQFGIPRAEARLAVVRARHAEGAADALAELEATARVEDARDGLRQARLQVALARIQLALAAGRP